MTFPGPTREKVGGDHPTFAFAICASDSCARSFCSSVPVHEMAAVVPTQPIELSIGKVASKTFLPDSAEGVDDGMTDIDS
jgi:hypothetical protein